jgi:hypothetical protein
MDSSCMSNQWPVEDSLKKTAGALVHTSYTNFVE